MSILSPTLVVIAAAALATGGCKTTATIERMRQEAQYDVQMGAHEKAIPKYNDLYDCVIAGELAEEGGKPETETDIEAKNELLWRMERGTIETIKGDVTLANQHLLRAAKLVDERRTTSVTREVGTYVGNDNAREYAGKGYEHTQVDYNNALSHLLQAERKVGLLAAATVSATATDTKAAAGAESTDASKPADYLFSRAHSLARRMVIDNIKYNKDNNPDLRYYDDPYARLFAAALVLATPADMKTGGDDSYAYDQFRRAGRIYTEQKKTFGADPKFRYEVAGVPATALRLAAQFGRQFDPGGYDELLKTYGVSANDPKVASAALPAGQGMLLVLNHADWITPTNALQIDLKVGIPWTPEVTPAEKLRGVTITPFRAWTTTFYAKGPGSEVAQGWGGAVAALAAVADAFGKLDPGTWIGFEIPAQRPDVAIPAVGSLLVDGKDAQPLEVLADLDAYARATLRDEQPGILTKTLTRVALKHASAAASQKAAEAAAGDDMNKKMAAKLLGTTSHAIASASESADTRHWTLLYDRIEGGLAYVPAGDHQVSIRTAAGTTDLGTVKVPAGQLVIVSARTFPNPVPNPYPAAK